MCDRLFLTIIWSVVYLSHFLAAITKKGKSIALPFFVHLLRCDYRRLYQSQLYMMMPATEVQTRKYGSAI